MRRAPHPFGHSASAVAIAVDPAPGLCLDFTRVPRRADRSGAGRKTRSATVRWLAVAGLLRVWLRVWLRVFRCKIRALSRSATAQQQNRPSHVCVCVCACACARECAYSVLRCCAPSLSFLKALKEIDKRGTETATMPATGPQQLTGELLRFWSSLWNCCETLGKGAFAHG